jgi:peptidoglycan/LPS O-acetylase OafA/YrhL
LRSTPFRAEALSTLTEFALGCGLVLGLLLLLAGMGDPGPGASAPWHVQLLPLSGFVVVGAAAVGIRIIGRPTRTPRRAGMKLIAIAVTLMVVAVWITVGASSARGLGSLLVILALPALVAGCVALGHRPRSEAV